MQHPERPALSDIVDSVADGAASLDWDAIEGGLANDHDRALIRQLRILARISDVHRTAGDEAAPGETLGPKVIGRIEPVAAPPVRPMRRSTSGQLPPSETYEGWGTLRLIEKVGEGTFGEVYRAFDTQLHREVALKLLKPEKSPSRLGQRILREGRILARVRHPHVVVVHGAETHDGRVGLWMDFIRGATLEKLVRKQGAFSAREAALIGQDLCRAMAAVHGAGLVHRDIKAQNVMREEGGRLVLMDFGAGRSRDEVGAERLTGTPLYLAPEVLSGGEATVRSDIYSLGVLLYYLVTASHPVKATSLEDLRTAHVDGRRVRLQDARADLPDGFTRVVERAIAPKADDRFASVGELQAALTPAFGPAFGTESLEGAAASRRPWWTLKRGGWLTVSAAATLTLVTGAGIWQLHRFGLDRTPGGGAPGRVTLAVLPFDADPSVPSYVTEELTRQVADILAISANVEVFQPTTTRALKAGGPSLAQTLPANARAQYTIVGSLSGTKHNIVGRVELRAEGRPTAVWSAPVVGRPARVAADVAAGVVRELGLPSRVRVAAGSQSELAHDLQAQARQQLDRGTDLTESIALFQKAIEAEPGFARAYSGLARAQLSSVPCSSNAELSRTAAHAALALDPNLAEAYAVLGWLASMCEWDWAGAEQHFARAVELNPSDIGATSGYAMFLAARDRADEGLEVMLRARALDLLSPATAAATATLYLYGGRYEAAEREARRAIGLDGTSPTAHVVLCRVLEAQGRFQDAMSACSISSHLRIRAGAFRMLSLQAALDARLGRVKEARASLESLRAQADGPSVDPVYLVFVYTALGDRDSAFRLMQEAVEHRSHSVMWLTVDPRVRDLRSDPRFTAYRAAMGLGPIAAGPNGVGAVRP